MHQIILSELFEKGADPQKLNINISKDSMEHKVMGYIDLLRVSVNFTHYQIRSPPTGILWI